MHATHPSQEALAAYERCLLTDEACGEIESHLLGCDSCCAVIESRIDPDFLDLVKQAGDTPEMGWTTCATARPNARLSAEGSWPGTVQVAGEPVPLLERDALWEALADHPKYRLLRVIGEGGMGVVFLAEHRLMKRPVALKAIKMSVNAESVLLARFRREVAANAQLTHPHIATAHDAEQFRGVCFLVLEYVEGENLAGVVAREGPLPVTRACQLARQAALALQHAADKGLTHRDIKPHNMLVTPGGDMKLVDFGLARVRREIQEDAGRTHATALLGTPDYLAPEQAFAPQDADIRADIYGLGCSLYHLLTGGAPFAAATLNEKLQAHLFNQPAPMKAARADVPPGLEAVVGRMMAKSPAERYQTPREVAEALAPFCEEVVAPVPEAKTEMAITEARPVRRRYAGWKVAAAVLLALGGLGLLGGVIYTIKTDNGELVIETDDPDVEVSIKSGGKEVTILDGKTKTKTTLRSGKYVAELKKGEGLTLETTDFVIKRGDTEVVKVRWNPTPVPKPGGGGNEKPSSLKEWFKEMVVGGEAKSFKRAPHVAIDKQGRFAIVWQAGEKKGADDAIYCRLFDENGKPRGDAFRVSTDHRGKQLGPHIAMSPAGKFVVAWGGVGQKGLGIYARRYTEAGKSDGPVFLVNTVAAAPDSPSPHGVAMNEKGDFVIAYQLGNKNPLGLHAYVQRFNAAGTKVGEELRVNDRKRVKEGASCVAIATDGSIAMVFAGVPKEVFLCTLKPDGSRGIIEELINDPRADDHPWVGSVAFRKTGGLTVLWSNDDLRNHGGEVRFRRYDGKFQPLDNSPVRLSDEGKKWAPSFGQRAAGDFLAVWQEMPNRAISSRYVDPTGPPRGAAFAVSTRTTGESIDPHVVMNEAGRCVVVWIERDEGKHAVYARGYQVVEK